MVLQDAGHRKKNWGSNVNLWVINKRTNKEQRVWQNLGVPTLRLQNHQATILPTFLISVFFVLDEN